MPSGAIKFDLVGTLSLPGTAIIILSALLTFIASCKKEDPPEDPSTSRLLKQMTTYDTAWQKVFRSSSFQYDSSGRISKITDEIYGFKDPFVYNFRYYPSKVIREYAKFNTSYVIERLKYCLDDDGLAVSDSFFSVGTLESTGTYQYDENGYLVKYTRFTEGDTSRWTSETHQVVNGNVISTVYKNYHDPGNALTVTYEYDPNSVNTLGNANKGLHFLGRSSTNLVISSITYWTTPGQAAFTYTIDGINRVSQQFIRGRGYLTESNNLACTYY